MEGEKGEGKWGSGEVGRGESREVGKWGSGERGAAGKKLWSHPIVDLNLGVQCR
jgi:hypothetical protein